MIKIKRLTSAFALLIMALNASLMHAQEEPIQAKKLDPRFNFFVEGKAIGNRVFQLGDAKNWSVDLQDGEGVSANGKLTVSADDYRGKRDALRLRWLRNQKVKTQLSLVGQDINISAAKEFTALTIDLKLIKKPEKPVYIGLGCGYPCGAEVRIEKQLRHYPKGEWAALPIPLNCFESDDFDLSKINGPFTIHTEGKFEVSIANIRLERLPEGSKGCKTK
ncbi:MAG: hypothetical protein ACI93R_000172 [Flavobacteriales bacterium]|jgi:hypothetical protein